MPIWIPDYIEPPFAPTVDMGASPPAHWQLTIWAIIAFIPIAALLLSKWREPTQ